MKKVDDIQEMLHLAVKMEEGSAKDHKIWAEESSAHADSVSKKRSAGPVLDEECHFDELDIEVDNRKKFGEKYLLRQSIERSKTIASGLPQE